jgi:transposase
MIVEALIAGMSFVGSVGCWAAVEKHRISAEMQKDKLKHDLEVLKPTPEPKIVEEPSPAQQSLTALLERRESLENHITELRRRVSDCQEARFAQYRTDSLKVLENARQEQQELVLEQVGLLEMMGNHVKARVKIEDDLEQQFVDLEESVEESKEAK